MHQILAPSFRTGIGAVDCGADAAHPRRLAHHPVRRGRQEKKAGGSADGIVWKKDGDAISSNHARHIGGFAQQTALAGDVKHNLLSRMRADRTPQALCVSPYDVPLRPDRHRVTRERGRSEFHCARAASNQRDCCRG